MLYHNRNFRLLWFSQSLQTLASTLLTVTIMVKVYQTTNSILGSGAILALSSLASFLSSYFAAKYISSIDVLKILRFVGWSRGLLTIILGILTFYSSITSLIFILILLFILSFIGAWYGPARFSLIPLIIERNEYIKANGSLTVINQVLLAGVWGLGGVLTVYVSPLILIAIIMASFFISGFLIHQIKIQTELLTVESNKKAKPLWSSLFQSPIVLNVTIMDFFEALANAIWSSALLLAFTKQVLQKGEAWWGFINASYFVGAIVGGLMVVFAAKVLEVKMGYIMALSGLSMGVLTLFFSYSGNGIIALLLCVLMGPMYQIRDTCQSTMLQDVIEPSERARVMAARNIILVPWTGVTYLIIGFIGDAIGIKNVFIFAAILYFMTAVLAMLLKELRNYSYRESTKSLT